MQARVFAAAASPDQQSYPIVSGNEVLCESRVGLTLANHSVIPVLVYIISLDFRRTAHANDAILVVENIISDNFQPTRFDNVNPYPGAIRYDIVDDCRMVRVLSSYSYITLNVMGNFILLNHSAAALHNQNPFLVIFIDLVVTDHRKSLLLNFDPCLPVIANHMVVADHRSIVLALDKHPIHLIPHNAYIFLHLGLANKFFVGSANYSIFLAFLYLVECYRWKSTVNLYPFTVLTDYVSGYLGLARQTHFNSHSVFVDTVGKDFQFELLSYQVDSY